MNPTPLESARQSLENISDEYATIRKSRDLFKTLWGAAVAREGRLTERLSEARNNSVDLLASWRRDVRGAFHSGLVAGFCWSAAAFLLLWAYLR